MDISLINSEVLRRLLTLSEKKEVLLNEIIQIENELLAITGGTLPPAFRTSAAPQATEAPFAPRPKGVRGKRGALKSQILALLTAAGDKGVRIQDIAAHLKISPQNIYVWFSSTGKSLGTIKKVSPGRYKLTNSAPKAASKAPAKDKQKL